MLLSVLRLFTALFLPLGLSSPDQLSLHLPDYPLPKSLSLSLTNTSTHTTVHSGTLILPWHHHVWMEALIALLNEQTFNLCLWPSSAHITKGCMSTQERMSCKNHLSWLLGTGMWVSERVCVWECEYVCVCGHKTKNARHNMWAPCATSHSQRQGKR